MRNMSFALTKDRILDKTKTVTRRQGWMFLKPGDLIQPVERCMGLKKGEKVTKIGGPIKIVDLHRELLDGIPEEDVTREGYPGMNPAEFVKMFCTHMKCKPSNHVMRIEFQYID